MSTSLRVGIVGPGTIASRHRAALSESRCAELVAIAGGSPERLKMRSEAWGIPVAESLDDLVGRHQIDAALVLTPTQSHFEQAAYFVERGIPVLLEKPPTSSLGQAIRLQAHVRAHEGFVMPSHDRIYRPAIRATRSAIAAGDIGRVVAASFTVVKRPPTELMMGWRRTIVNPAGGALADSGYHLIYVAAFLLGVPTAVFGRQARFQWQLASEDTASALLCFADGLTAALTQSWAADSRSNLPEIVIWGTTGTVTIDSQGLAIDGERVQTEDVDSFVEMIRCFCDAVNFGTRPLHTLDDAVVAMAACDAYYRSCCSQHLEPIRSHRPDEPKGSLSA